MCKNFFESESVRAVVLFDGGAAYLPFIVEFAVVLLPNIVGCHAGLVHDAHDRIYGGGVFVEEAKSFLLRLMPVKFWVPMELGNSMAVGLMICLPLVLSRLWRPILCVSFFGFVWELITAIVASNEQLQMQMSILTPTANIAAALAVIALLSWSREAFSLVPVYWVVFPIAATGFLLMPFLGTVYQVTFSAVACGFAVVSILMQVACVRDCKSTGSDPMILISVFAGVVYLFMTAGFFVGRWVLPLGSVDPPMLLVISLLLVYALALVGFALRFRKSGASRKKPNGAGVSRSPESGDLYRAKTEEYGLTE